MGVPIRTAAELPSRVLNVKERALWMLQRLFPDSGITNEAYTFAVPGRLDRDVLARQVQALVARHPALRTVFPERDGRPAAIVLPAADAPIPLHVVDDPQQPIEVAVAEFAGAPFDIVAETPLRVGLFRYRAWDVCCIAVHHLIYDARSAAVLFADLATGYNADLAAGGGTDAGPAAAIDPVEPLTEPDPAPESVRYWQAQVAGVDPDRQAMALGQENPHSDTFAGSARRHELSAEACAAVTDLAKRHRATENIVLLAAFYLLLAKHGAGPDLAVGVSVDARDAAERPAVGYHVNSLPIRVTVDLSDRFRALVSATRNAFLTGLLHRGVSYESVLPDLWTAGARWRAPLFRYMFNYRQLPVPQRTTLGDLPVELVFVPPRHSLQDLVLTVETGRGAGSLLAVYRTDVFSGADVTALLERYDALLVALGAAADDPLTDVGCWTHRDRTLVDTGNDTRGTDGAPLVLDAVVAAAGDGRSVAMVDDGTEVTYRGLLDTAAGIRDRLLDADLGDGGVVALYADRGPGLAAAVLGTWAAGRAYLPLHPDNPADLLSFQLADSGSVAVLADRPLPAGTEVPCPLLPLAGPPAATPAAPLVGGPAATDTAYVIYTSGSTGRPKGVEVTHGNLANLIRHFTTLLTPTVQDSVLWLSTYAFDISALELLLPLSAGARVVVAPDAARADGELLMDRVTRYDVRILQATPSTLAQLDAAAAGPLAGRVVLCGGEPLPSAVAATLLGSGCQLFNVYGPTETTIWSTVARLTADDIEPVPVGVPIRDTTVFVVDRHGAELPPGVTGELCIGGAGVARGYLDRPELTAERFPVSPRYGRYYRTGDRARWRYDGTVLLHGRHDRQVKLRAHRIELGEVEAVLTGHPSVAAVAVLLRDDLPGGPGLVAYVQPRGDDVTGLADALWQHARATLPGYALPAHVEVGRVPHTPSGKVDYRTLSNRSIQHRQRDDRPEDTDSSVEDVLAVWRTMLGNPDIGPDDNFFLAGGQSLTAVRMLALVSRRVGARLSLDGLLNHPTPVAFSRYIALAGAVTGHS